MKYSQAYLDTFVLLDETTVMNYPNWYNAIPDTQNRLENPPPPSPPNPPSPLLLLHFLLFLTCACIQTICSHPYNWPPLFLILLMPACSDCLFPDAQIPHCLTMSLAPESISKIAYVSIVKKNNMIIPSVKEPWIIVKILEVKA